jgi:hypothetical protein
LEIGEGGDRQFAGDRVQRHVHDGGVENDHQLADAQNEENKALMQGGLAHCVSGGHGNTCG